MAATHTVDMEEYLRTSYKHDPEYIDGEIRKRPMPTRLHAFVQAAISAWFIQHMTEWNMVPYSEVRTRVRPQNFRLPDVAVARRGPMSTKTLDEAPLIAIEILSDDDRTVDLQNRAIDFTAMGTKNVWLLHPDVHQAYIWTSKGEDKGSWLLSETLAAAGTPVYLDLNWLWQRIAEAQEV